MIFLGKEIPIEKIKGRIRSISTPTCSIGDCVILSYQKNSVMMLVIKSARAEHMNKIVYVSSNSFFMNLSEEHIQNRKSKLPPVNVGLKLKLYDKR